MELHIFCLSKYVFNDIIICSIENIPQSSTASSAI